MRVPIRTLPILFDLPEQPTSAGPAGLGANYFVANDRSTNAASLFVKQAFVRFKDLGGVEGQSLKIGRMEFFDGAEVSPKNETLASLKRDRVAARLLANFGFTHIQRSVDGVQYGLDRPTVNVTLLAARPTRGVFQVDGWGELNINVLYGAITSQSGDATNAGEWRLFGLAYSDYRDGIVKTDNRPLAARQADRGHVNIGTFGGHYIRAVDRPHGTIDVLLCGIRVEARSNQRHSATSVSPSTAVEVWRLCTTPAPMSSSASSRRFRVLRVRGGRPGGSCQLSNEPQRRPRISGVRDPFLTVAWLSVSDSRPHDRHQRRYESDFRLPFSYGVCTTK